MRPYGQRGNISLPGFRKDAEGRALCRWCDQPVPKRRKSWCSKKCVDEWRERGDWNHIRKKIIERDKVCQMCGGQRYHCEYVIEADPRYPSRLAQCKIAKAWDVDHIVAVEDGGTDDPANLRLLCRKCHKERTALQRRQKALQRRNRKVATVADTCEHWITSDSGSGWAVPAWNAACIYCELKKLRGELSLAEEGLANSALEIKQLRDAIEAHQLAVCDNPKAAGQDADERLWAVLQQPEKS